MRAKLAASQPVRASAELPVAHALPVRAEYPCKLLFGDHTAAQSRDRQTTGYLRCSLRVVRVPRR